MGYRIRWGHSPILSKFCVANAMWCWNGDKSCHNDFHRERSNTMGKYAVLLNAGPKDAGAATAWPRELVSRLDHPMRTYFDELLPVG